MSQRHNLWQGKLDDRKKMGLSERYHIASLLIGVFNAADARYVLRYGRMPFIL